MKTNQDKATVSQFLFALALVTKISQFRDSDKMIKSERELYALLKGDALTEHTALVAVAEAANRVENICGSNIPKFAGEAGEELMGALAALAAIRQNGGAK